MVDWFTNNSSIPGDFWLLAENNFNVNCVLLLIIEIDVRL